MLYYDSIFAFPTRIRQLAAISKSVKLATDGVEMDIEMPNGFPKRFNPVINAFDALRDEKILTFELVKSSLLQKQKRNQQRLETSIHKTEESAQIFRLRDFSRGVYSSKNIRQCNHCCHKNHISDQWFIKHLDLRTEYDKRCSLQEEHLIAKSALNHLYVIQISF